MERIAVATMMSRIVLLRHHQDHLSACLWRAAPEHVAPNNTRVVIAAQMRRSTVWMGWGESGRCCHPPKQKPPRRNASNGWLGRSVSRLSSASPPAAKAEHCEDAGEQGQRAGDGDGACAADTQNAGQAGAVHYSHFKHDGRTPLLDDCAFGWIGLYRPGRAAMSM